MLRLIYRHRLPVYYGAIGAIVAGVVLPRLADALRPAALVLTFLGLVGASACLLASFLIGRRLPEREPIRVLAPVTGRWLAMNSPATKVPSHGVRLYGQAYAIDLAFEPETAEAGTGEAGTGELGRPEFGDGPAMRPPEDYPAFGQPVRAMVAGTVVRVDDRQRDHRARSSVGAVFYLLAEGALRELGGPRRVVGNHVVIDAGDGVFALLAHLRRGSATVRVGDVVTAGQTVGRCGNSGNSSEPHVHAQLMDRASPLTGQGLPLVFMDVRVGGQPGVGDGMPANGEHLHAC